MQAHPANSHRTQPRRSQFIAWLVTILCFLSIGVLSVHADRATLDPTRTQTALPLDAPPIIDGVIDAAEWGRAGGFQGNYWSVLPDANALDGIRGGVLGAGPVPEDI